MDNSDLNNLEYMFAFLKEVLRIMPPILIVMFRIAKEDHFLTDKIKIKKGNLVTSSMLSVMNNPKYFENPDKFYPERFFEN
jgi:cytochrome P450